MARNFSGACFQCGERGHRRVECPRNRAGGDTESVDDSVYRGPPVFGRHERAELDNERFGQRAGGFGGNTNAPPAFSNHQQQAYQPQPQQYQQQQYQQQRPISPQPFMGVQVPPMGQPHLGVVHNATGAELPAALEEFRRETGIQNPRVPFTSGQTVRETVSHFTPLSTETERERMRRHRRVDISTVHVMRPSDPARPAQVPQRQAGRGALPGARNAQPNRDGSGMLGHHRVEKPRGQGQQQRRGAIQDSGRGERPVHTDHPPGFECRVCGNTGHMEADCAKPSSTGDSSFCPYHRTVSGSEEHADSKCRMCVDRCWEAAEGKDGKTLPRAQIDSYVAKFVRAHRGGRPEPRCAEIHSHWAMCVSRYILANGLGSLDASLLPVRRSEVARRMSSGQLSWKEFNHENDAESRMQFRDTHWDCESADELIEKLRDYAFTGTYHTASQRRARRTAEDEKAVVEDDGDGMDLDDESGSSQEDKSGNGDQLSDAPSHIGSDVGNGLSSENYGPPHERRHSEL